MASLRELQLRAVELRSQIAAQERQIKDGLPTACKIAESKLPGLRRRLAECEQEIAVTPDVPRIAHDFTVRGQIDFNRTTALSADELHALEIPAFLKRTA